MTNKTFITVGRLVSTTDMALARQLQQIVNVNDITGGATLHELIQYGQSISFMFGGEFYELERLG